MNEIEFVIEIHEHKTSDGQVAGGPVVVCETETKELYSNERISYSGVNQLHAVAMLRKECKLEHGSMVVQQIRQ